MPERPERIQFVADRGDARLRLDQVLVRRVTAVARVSRAQAQSWIEGGAVLVDGRRAARSSIRVREGAAVDLVLPTSARRRSRPAAEDRPLEVIYEDAELLAVDKPAGLVAHPSYKNASGTLLNAVLGRFRGAAGVRPGIVTRLDKDTSGVVLVALTAGVHARLQRTSIRKEYFAIVKGTPTPRRGTIELSLGRDPCDRRRVVVDAAGVPSATRYEVVKYGEGLSLVRCELLTGRTHQIRVHLAARGWPILGDAVYGAVDDRIARTALHAWRVRLAHPAHGALVDIRAPLPADLRALARCLAGARHVPGTVRDTVRERTLLRRTPLKESLMGRGTRIDAPGMLHHVVNRATEKRRIFDNSADYAVFLALLAAARERFPVDLLAYCVMPNHWHLVLRPLVDHAIPAYMHWVTGRHARHLRFTTGTTGRGHVYQGRYRSSIVEDELYYWNLFRYVEANPVRAGLVERAEKWEWGSLYERENQDSRLLSPPPIPLPPNWADIVNQGIDPLELAQFRESLQRCATPERQQMAPV